MNYHSKISNELLDFIPKVLKLKEFCLKNTWNKVVMSSEFSNANLARLFYQSK